MQLHCTIDMYVSCQEQAGCGCMVVPQGQEGGNHVLLGWESPEAVVNDIRLTPFNWSSVVRMEVQRRHLITSYIFRGSTLCVTDKGALMKRNQAFSSSLINHQKFVYPFNVSFSHKSTSIASSPGPLSPTFLKLHA